jgi:hypothetical protein
MTKMHLLTFWQLTISPKYRLFGKKLVEKKHTSLFNCNISDKEEKAFLSIETPDRSSRIPRMAEMDLLAQTVVGIWGQCYKTCYVRNLRFFVIS